MHQPKHYIIRETCTVSGAKNMLQNRLEKLMKKKASK